MINTQKKRHATSVTERREMILHGNTFHVLWRLSIPTLMMAAVSALIPLSDGLFLNNSAGHIVAGAVGYSQPIIQMVNALSLGLGTAAMAILGQLNGQGDMNGIRHFSTQMMVFSTFLGVLLAPVMVLAAFLLTNRMDPQLAPLVFTYLSLYALVIPFLFLAAIFNSFKNATGQPEATFYRMIILLILKIIFNALYLTALKWGIVGAVMASFSSYLIIGIWMYYDLFIKQGELRLSLKGYRFDKAAIKRLVRLGVPTMISSFMMNLGFFLINQEVVSFGPVALNAQTIASNINSMEFTLPSSIGTTITTMVSVNIAAGREENAKKIFFQGCILTLILCALMIAVFVPLSPTLVRLFLNNPTMSQAVKNEIFSIAVPAMNIYTASIVGFGIFMAVQGAFVGLANTRAPLVAGVLRIWILRYVFILFTKEALGIFSIFWGNLFSNIIAAIIFFIWLMKTDWSQGLMRSAGVNLDRK